MRMDLEGQCQEEPSWACKSSPTGGQCQCSCTVLPCLSADLPAKSRLCVAAAPCGRWKDRPWSSKSTGSKTTLTVVSVDAEGSHDQPDKKFGKAENGATCN